MKKSILFILSLVLITTCSWTKKEYCSDRKLEGQYENGSFKQYHPNGMLLIDALWRDSTVLYYQMYDSLGNKTNSYRHIEIIPEKEKYEVRDILKAKVIISGPENCKNLVIVMDAFPSIGIKVAENVLEYNYMADSPFLEKTRYRFFVNVWCDSNPINYKVICIDLNKDGRIITFAVDSTHIEVKAKIKNNLQENPAATVW